MFGLNKKNKELENRIKSLEESVKNMLELIKADLKECKKEVRIETLTIGRDIEIRQEMFEDRFIKLLTHLKDILEKQCNG